MSEQPYYRQTAQQALESQQADLRGLSEAEVRRRAEQYGPNKLSEGKKKSTLQVFLEQFKDLLVIILIIAALISAVSENVESTIVIFAVLILNAIAAALAAANGIWGVIDQISAIVETAKAGAELESGLVWNLVLGLLLPVGLVLVNLAMEFRQLPARARKVDGGRYRRGLGGFVGSFYTGVGGKLQLLAKIGGALCLVLGILGVVLILLGVLVLLLQLVGLIPSGFEPTSLMLGGLIGVVSALILAVSTWPLYAFGQITADLHAIRKGGISAAAPESAAQPAASRENPDELPEL